MNETDSTGLDIDGLTVVHRPRDAAGDGLPARQVATLRRHGFYAATCLREITITGSRPLPELNFDTATQLMHGSAAYFFLLQTITGLNSSVAGETNVQGQIRRAWNQWRHTSTPAAVAELDGLMHRLFADSRSVRRQFLQGIGGNSYASLTRKLLGNDAASRILFVGAGDLARSMLPLFSGSDCALWNRHATTAPDGIEARVFAPGEQAAAAAWATHIVVTTPPDDVHDASWWQLARQCANPPVVHLGRRRMQRGPWRDYPDFADLDDLFDLREAQAARRSRQVQEARTACARLAAPRLRLGTRDSLLAIAQSRQVATQLEARHPGLQVELVTMSTRGDHDVDTPLCKVADPAFFSDSLDNALGRGDIDFSVHSWKDIDGARPAGFTLAAVPARERPHDALLFRADIAERIASGATLRIGTCSERRRINAADFLSWALPGGNPPTIEFADLRGPVDKRLERIAPTAGDMQLDGVIIALAGLERLWNDTPGRAAIAPLLAQARWMIMPLEACPAAAAQGALALEALRTNSACIELLRAVHDPASKDRVDAEQQLLQSVGAGDRAGATVVAHDTLGWVGWLRGRRPNGDLLSRTIRAEQPLPPQGRRKGWDGDGWRRATRREPLATGSLTAPAVFIAHADALPADGLSPDCRVWTSGPSGWRTLARAGVWVEGCLDNLGFAAGRELLGCEVLQLPRLEHWTALTHTAALDSWRDSGVRSVIPSYEVVVDADPAHLRDELRDCTHFFWSSARQFRTLQALVPADAHHACGPGKTWQALRKAGVHAEAFASRREWQEWLG